MSIRGPIDIRGAVDIHVHAGPELFPRLGDAIAFARRAKALGMFGFVCKCIHEPSASRAQMAERVVEGIRVWGGIVLNEFVGGVNPVAVSGALATGSKIVWMPTIHARNHVEKVGAGTYGLATMTVPRAAGLSAGICVLDDSGNLIPEAKDVIRMVAEADAAVATGHLSETECLAVAREAQTAGARCILTHAHFPEHSLETLHAISETGAWIEISAAVASPVARHIGHSMTMQDVLDLVETVGHERMIISTDSGQIHSAYPADVLRGFATLVAEVGVDVDAVRQMIVENPCAAIGVETPTTSQGLDAMEDTDEDA